MNLKNIKEGQEFKNYKELCAALEEPYFTNTCQRKSHLKEIERYVELRKIGKGNKLRIISIYETPKEKPDKRAVGIYVKYIETVLLQYLCSQENHSIYIGMYDLCGILGFMNKKYNSACDEYYYLKENSDIDMHQFHLFKNRCYKKFYDILISSLNSLSRRKLIIYSKEIIIYKNDMTDFIADATQAEQVLEIERDILRELEMYSINHVYWSNSTDKYYRRVNELLDKKYGWHHAIRKFHIIFTKKHTPEALEENIIELKRMEMNRLMKQALDKQADTQYSDYEDKCTKEQIKLLNGSLLPIEKTPTYQKSSKNYPLNFVDIQKRLSEEFIIYLRE